MYTNWTVRPGRISGDGPGCRHHRPPARSTLLNPASETETQTRNSGHAVETELIHLPGILEASAQVGQHVSLVVNLLRVDVQKVVDACTKPNGLVQSIFDRQVGDNPRIKRLVLGWIIGVSPGNGTEAGVVQTS